jgi:DUF1707 SHOCT-like domain/Domain of unknown function (DUF4190)
VTENPATESAGDRDGTRGAPGYEPTRYAQPASQGPPPPFLAQAAPPPPPPYQAYAQQPYQPQPPPPPAYPQPVQVPLAPPPRAPVPPAYVQPPAAPRPAYPPPPADVPRGNAGGPPGMLASTADRERAIDVCKASYGEGRLTKEEFDARVSQITASRTYGDLAAVISDLPAGPLGGVSHYQAGGYPIPVPSYPPQARPTNGLAIGSLVCALMGISLPAVIMGHIARAQIADKHEGGDGLAVAGLVVGWLGMAAWTLLFILAVVAAHR